MTKKIILLITLSSLFIFSGCSTSTENQKLASVEVYSSDKQTLLTTIEDKESLNTFNENTSMTDQWEKMADDDAEQQEHIEEELGNYKTKNIFIVYQTSKAVISSDTLEEMMEITVYENTNIVEVKISPNTVKNILVSSEDLTYYYEVSDDVLEYLTSVAQKYFFPSPHAFPTTSPKVT